MMDAIPVRQAYLAMYHYLETLFEETHAEDLGEILGSMSFLADDSTADPAAWYDWIDAINETLDTVLVDTITAKQGYVAMYFYIDELQKRVNSEDLNAVLSGMELSPEGETVDPVAWNNWLHSVKTIIDANDESYGRITFVYDN